MMAAINIAQAGMPDRYQYRNMFHISKLTKKLSQLTLNAAHLHLTRHTALQ